MGFLVPPSRWEIQHAAPIFAAQQYQAAHDGRLPSTRMWRMLEFRHNLNARRFNFFHPNIGRMIEAQNMVPPTPILPPVPPVVPPVVPPTDPGGGGGTGEPPPNPQGPGGTVPEPSAFLMFAAAMLVVGLGFTRIRRRAR